MSVEVYGDKGEPVNTTEGTSSSEKRPNETDDEYGQRLAEEYQSRASAAMTPENQAEAIRFLNERRCEVCKRTVPLNDIDYGVCGTCRRLALGAEEWEGDEEVGLNG